jgi:hypothetical protein
MGAARIGPNNSNLSRTLSPRNVSARPSLMAGRHSSLCLNVAAQATLRWHKNEPRAGYALGAHYEVGPKLSERRRGVGGWKDAVRTSLI